MNTSQLRLVAARPDWKLDEETKDIGRRGLQMARQALQSSTKLASIGHQEQLAA